MAVDPNKLLTYEDFLSFPDDGVRREIVDGEMLVTPAPNMRHQALVIHLGAMLHVHVEEHGGGRAFVAPVDVRLTEHDVVEPDAIFVAEDRFDILEKNYMLGPPTLLVEVISNPRTDRVRKRDMYARAGVPTYWIVDPDGDRVEVYRLQSDGTYGKPVMVEPGEMLTLDELPGLRIDVARLFDR